MYTKRQRLICYTCTAIATVVACKKPYTPALSATSTNYLVVDALINTGTDSTFVTLSRTVNVSSKVSSIAETGASVTIEGSGGFAYNLVPVSNGRYAAPPLNLSSTQNYRLHITTLDGSVYESDYVQPANTPAIDSVNYIVKSNGVQINVNTHGPNNGNRYYRWTYDETWSYHSAFYSLDKVIHVPKDTIIARPVTEQIYYCWHNDTSADIMLGSTERLTQNVVNAQPVLFIPGTSERFTDIYSIQVKQFAITPDAYNYFSILKRNTEQLGGIFDAQPSELTGNVKCISDPSKIAIGYVTAGNITKARIFIDNRKLPNWNIDNPYAGCVLDSLYLAKVSPQFGTVTNEVADYIYTGFQMPLVEIMVIGNPKPVGYRAGIPFCVDCSLRGTTKRPAFWPQ